jgi:hypothetical protein
VGWKNAGKAETIDNQDFARMSIFCVFSANIPFSSNNGPFLGAKIQNFLDKPALLLNAIK